VLPFLLWLAFSTSAFPAQASSSLSRTDPPATNGPIHWWPNPFDARDEITGQEGVVMGVLPVVDYLSPDRTEFGAQTGWVQLRPALNNTTFTLAFWFHARPCHTEPQILLAQEGRDA
jgi:hypothetical protein